MLELLRDLDLEEARTLFLSMGGLVEALHKYPDQLGRLRADRSLIANAAQEIVRWQSPVTHMRRTLTKDAELAGQSLKAGEKIVLWYISGNRDESVFPDADRYDVARANAAAIRDEYLDCPPVIEILDFIAAESDRALSSPNRGKN